MSRRRYDDYDDDEFYDDYSRKGRKKKHQQESERRRNRNQKAQYANEWEALYEDLYKIDWPQDDNDNEVEEVIEEAAPIEKQPEVIEPQVIAQTDSKTFGASKTLTDPYTHTIKGNTINFARVINMVKVENEYNDKLTYGIKFIFKGSTEAREFSRIAWFNINILERDRVFNTEHAFWISIQ
ncbi:MAG: hypothetical protein J6S67_08575 [Methanobrevibacter sp.]|nr:hypothetical protein [Methanobrevibacter sp.]